VLGKERLPPSLFPPPFDSITLNAVFTDRFRLREEAERLAFPALNAADEYFSERRGTWRGSRAVLPWPSLLSGRKCSRDRVRRLRESGPIRAARNPAQVQ